MGGFEHRIRAARTVWWFCGRGVRRSSAVVVINVAGLISPAQASGPCMRSQSSVDRVRMHAPPCFLCRSGMRSIRLMTLNAATQNPQRGSRHFRGFFSLADCRGIRRAIASGCDLSRCAKSSEQSSPAASTARVTGRWWRPRIAMARAYAPPLSSDRASPDERLAKRRTGVHKPFPRTRPA